MGKRNRLDGVALLLAAHGERRDGAFNESLDRLALALAERDAADEVALGFIKGAPTIAQAIGDFATTQVVVYPVFLSDGYFVRVRLTEILRAEAAAEGAPSISMLPPLGLDPALADLVAARVATAARERGVAVEAASIVLFAHGSTTDPASRLATERLAERLRARKNFGAVHVALLEEPPSLAEATRHIADPAFVVGLFAGEGMHGGEDAPRLVADLSRPEIVFAGNIGADEGIVDVVSAAVARASTEATPVTPVGA